MASVTPERIGDDLINGDLSMASALRRMLLIRRFEERVLELSETDWSPDRYIPASGKRRIPVGAMAALQPQDRVLSTYRGHGWALATGAPVAAVLGEIAHARAASMAAAAGRR